MNLLSVDWDYFFPVIETGPEEALYDWGHKENPFYINGPIWIQRAATFIGNKKALPSTSGDERNFWSRFTFSENAQLFIAESHSYALNVGEPTHIVSYDAHHDCGYNNVTPKSLFKQFVKGEVFCDDWLAYMIMRFGSDATVLYPDWRSWQNMESKPVIPVNRTTDDGKPRNEIFDAVFVCRSGAWTPPWIDHELTTFLDRCPIKASRRVMLDDVSPRLFDLDEAEKVA